jgi:hypothetical protein
VIFFEQIPWADADPTFRPVDTAEMHSFRAGAAGTPGTLGPAATDLLTSLRAPCARGARGGREASCPGQPLIGTEQQARNRISVPPSGSRFRWTGYVGDRPAVRALQSAKPPRS